VSAGPDGPGESTEELFEDAPCGFISTRPDGTIVRANRTLATWLGYPADALIGRRFASLLTAGGRIYHETHYAPLLRMQGAVREIALEVVRADGSRLPVLVNSALVRDADGAPRGIRTMLFDATDRRRYERELLAAREREHAVATELQHGLLSGTLPHGDGFTLEIAYRPAGLALEVGGDWYDAFAVGDGDTLTLVVGDVVGRGIGPATTMGQLRSAVRALAGADLAPGPLLGELDRYTRRHGVGEMTTVAVAEVDLAAATVRVACAGHPPPLVLEPGHDARLLWGGRSMPLGASATPVARPHDTAPLAPGATIMLYTDGLVERRDASLDDRLAQLRDAAGAARDAPLEQLTAAVLEAMVGSGGPDDDVCLLALRTAA
jgi:phosphoserine phosphatase RsbU/P